jgi:magnesium chelatase ATPase subunit I
MNRRSASVYNRPPEPGPLPPVYPFTAIVAQEEMKLALLLNTIDPTIGGVLLMGHRGTGKSTAVRALADLLPLMQRTKGCAFGCDAKDTSKLCADCAARLKAGEKLRSERVAVPVVELPLGATEDRVCGTINIERAITEGVKAFEPGLLARAHRGFLYIDEVNLLEDHLVDLLLDVTVTGRNVVEREGISMTHPARFVLVGSGNPEEGELRPQLLDRFGLYVEVSTVNDLDERVLIVERRDMFEREPQGFRAAAKGQQERLRRRLIGARRSFAEVTLPRPLLRRIAELCLQLGTDGHRGELTIARAARSLAAFEGRRAVAERDVRRVAVMALRHRLRRDPLEQTASATRIQDALEQLFPASAEDIASAQTAEERSEAESLLKGAKTAKKSKPTKKAGPDGGGSGNGSSNNGGDGTAGDGVDGALDGGASRHVQPSPGARLAEDSLDHSSSSRQRAAIRTPSSRRQRERGHSSYNSRSGRYARAAIDSSGTGRIALDATLRAAAERLVGGKQRQIQAPNGLPLMIDKEALRYKRFKRKAGALFIFAVDASGSMALNRIGQAKGALTALLQRSYVRRDRVALVSFRARSAELLLPPCQSVVRARRMLDALPVGGATPLSAGLSAAIELARRAAREGVQEISLLLFTDGRANVSLQDDETFDRATRRSIIAGELRRLGAMLRQTGVETTVVDTQHRFVRGGEAERLAETLGCRHTSLSSNPTQYPLIA